MSTSRTRTGSHEPQNDLTATGGKELNTAWPADLDQLQHYGSRPNHRKLLALTSFIARHARNDISWSYFYKTGEEDQNVVAQHESMILVLENMFKSELHAPFAREHQAQLRTTDMLIVARHLATNQIIGFSCAKIEPEPGNIQGQSVVYGGLVVIRKEFQRTSIGILMAAQFLSFNRRARNIFDDLFFVARTNNKYMLGPMKACGDVFRSDQLGDTSAKDALRVRALMSHMHHNILNIDEPLDWTKPAQVEHFFEEKVRIDGVGGNEIIYALCRTNLIKATVKLVARSRNKKQKK